MEDNIFKPDMEKGEIFYWIITGIMAIGIAANFDAISAKIAIIAVKVLTGGIPILVLGLLVLYGLVSLGWRRRRWFW